MVSPIYWHPFLYRLTVKLLYGQYFEARYQAISEIIPEYAKVAEFCAGDAYLYLTYLKPKGIVYKGFDCNVVFVNSAKRKGIPFLKNDLMVDNIPSADYIILHASLYQFIPSEDKIIRKLLSVTNKVLIIAEPIHNLSTSNIFFIRLLAKYLTNPGKVHAKDRFNEDMLMECFKKFPEFKDVKMIEGGREMIGIFRK